MCTWSASMACGASGAGGVKPPIGRRPAWTSSMWATSASHSASVKRRSTTTQPSARYFSFCASVSPASAASSACGSAAGSAGMLARAPL